MSTKKCVLLFFGCLVGSAGVGRLGFELYEEYSLQRRIEQTQREMRVTIAKMEATNRLEAGKDAVRLANRYCVEDYHRISQGMDFLSVVIILGSTGEELSRGSLGDFESKVCSWRNPDGSNITATFQNSKLVAKAQFGLKYRNAMP